MNFRILYITLSLVILPAYYSHSQDSCENPLPPELVSATVIAETSTVILNWTLSQSPGVTAYIIYLYETRDGNSEFYAIDTVRNPSATTYYDRRIQFKSFRYRVAAFKDPKCISELSNIVSTIHVETLLDTCNGQIHLTWNPYLPPAPRVVVRYTILESVNGSSYSEIGTTGPEVRDFTVNDFTINSEYCYKVIASIDHGSGSGSTSASGATCVKTSMQKPPDWINADYATINDLNKISLSFTIDPSSEAKLFSLERMKWSEGLFSQIALIGETRPGNVTYTDNVVSGNTVYSYRLAALNPCNVITTYSNIASNILLESIIEGYEIKLRWNKYREWNGNVSSYRIFMDTGNGFIEAGMVSPGDTTFTINIPEIMYSMEDTRICFFARAEETGNPFGIQGEAQSNLNCINLERTLTVPNIFTPDGDLVNDLFKPVLTYTPADYRLTITDRLGRILFETSDYTESWDGNDKQGIRAGEGVYLWFISIQTRQGNSIAKSGTVTLMRR